MHFSAIFRLLNFYDVFSLQKDDKTTKEYNFDLKFRLIQLNEFVILVHSFSETTPFPTFHI